MDFNCILKTSLIFAISVIFSSSYAATNLHAIVCDQAYALCTSARCVPDPKNPSASICDCVAQNGKSAGFTTCEKRKPYVDQYKATHLVSTFSFEQFAEKKTLSCPKGNPWSNCVDMPCSVDPQNTNRAICLCQLNNTQAFFSFGGNCESNTCASGFWSGAVPGEASNVLRDALIKDASSPVSSASCSVNGAN